MGRAAEGWNATVFLMAQCDGHPDIRKARGGRSGGCARQFGVGGRVEREPTRGDVFPFGEGVTMAMAGR